jgi:mannose-6-phosphate isomerase-like protein (cupin superfamily)
VCGFSFYSDLFCRGDILSKTDLTDTKVGSFDLSVTPIHLDSLNDSKNSAIPLNNFGFDGPAFEAYINEYCAAGPGRLVMVEITATNWVHWECHTLGDEIVIVLEGRANFIQEREGQQPTILPVQAGSTIINPRDVWHTADVSESLKAIYITPCKGTKHRER